MNLRNKVLLTVGLSIIALLLGIGIGSVWITPGDILRILGHKFFQMDLPENISDITVNILWKLRMPRAVLAFLVGGALSSRA